MKVKGLSFDFLQPMLVSTINFVLKYENLLKWPSEQLFFDFWGANFAFRIDLDRSQSSQLAYLSQISVFLHPEGKPKVENFTFQSQGPNFRDLGWQAQGRARAWSIREECAVRET